MAPREREQDEPVRALARAFVSEGQSRAKPFAGCGGPTPAALIHVPIAEEARVIHTLVMALQRSLGLSKATQQALKTADKAAPIEYERLDWYRLRWDKHVVPSRP